jgi:hypothetical protein
VEGVGDLQPLAVGLVVQSPNTLLAVLATTARLGCRLTAVHASGQQIDLEVLVPRPVAHRVLPCLGQLIEVLAVWEAVRA